MKAQIYIDKDCIGETDFRIADEAMGGIVGDLKPKELYQKYKSIIQTRAREKGIANLSDFNLRIVIAEGETLHPVGGVGITDSEEFEQIIVEAAGNTPAIIEKIKTEAS